MARAADLHRLHRGLGGTLHALLDEVEAAGQFEVEAAGHFDAMSAERSSNGLSSDRNRERRSSTTGSIHGAGEPTFLGDIAIKVCRP